MVISLGKVTVDDSSCTQCGICVDICPNNALDMMENGPALKYPELCTECGICEDQCPSHSIAVPRGQQTTAPGQKPRGDEKWIAASDQMVSLLGLSKPPVGIRLVREGEDLPTGFVSLDFPVRHCVSIHMASLGVALHVPASQHACSAGKAALGIAELPDKVRSGKVPYMHGLASSESAAARIMSEIPKLPLGTCTGTLVAPLSCFQSPPQVVVLTCLPQQAMWVANSLIFQSGGPRITANFAGMQAACGDVTAVPILTGNVNFSFGCYGCRSVGKLKDDEMYVGIPTLRIDAVVSGLRGLRRAMAKLETVQTIAKTVSTEKRKE